jgi:hypothetical protein
VKVIDPGHVYDLDWLDGQPEEGILHNAKGAGPYVIQSRLIFVKRMGETYPGNLNHFPGTTIQEVLRALIDRVRYLDGQIPDIRNKGVVRNLQDAIWLLEQRAAERHGRTLDITALQIEGRPTCPKCLHVGCDGRCHP